jgi:hypothetical protein
MNALRVVGSALAETYRRGAALFLVAPLAVALVVVPEFLQHIAEIHIGMFESREAARAVANDSSRWMFGYAKLTGLSLAFLAAPRVWWWREEGGAAWWRLDRIDWLTLIVGIAIVIGIPALAEIPRGAGLARTAAVTGAVLTIVTLPGMFHMLKGLFADRATSVRGIWTRGWRFVPLLLLLLVAAFGPAMALHYATHALAFGRPVALVWLLMAADALVVGLLASLVGAALFVGYRAFRSSAA